MLQIIADFGNINLFGLGIPLRVFGYGLMLVLGFLLGIYLARWRARRSGENPDLMTHCGMLALVGGILGARIAYIMQPTEWRRIMDTPSPFASALNITSGGLVYYGGVILAAILVAIYLRVRHLPIRRYMDCLAVSLMIGLAFGRLGCFLNGCCYGSQCSDDFAMGVKFPMYSKPLLKLDGENPGNPFSEAVEGPSPVYSKQLAKTLRPDARLMSELGSLDLHLPRYLHGALTNDQVTDTSDETKPAAQLKFRKYCGLDGMIDFGEFRQAQKAGDLLKGSEHFDDALRFSGTHDNKITFDELWTYLQTRNRMIVQRFDANADGKIDGDEQKSANQWLSADEYVLAGAQRALPVKPAQLVDVGSSLVIAGILMLFYRYRTREGQVIALLMLLYPITRFILEMIRDDNPHNLMSLVLTHNQYTSIVLLVIGVVMWLGLRKLPASAGRTWAQRLADERIDSAGRKALKS